MKEINYIYAIESCYDGCWSVETYAETAKEANELLKIYSANTTAPVRIRKMRDDD